MVFALFSLVLPKFLSDDMLLLLMNLNRKKKKFLFESFITILCTLFFQSLKKIFEIRFFLYSLCAHMVNVSPNFQPTLKKLPFVILRYGRNIRKIILERCLLSIRRVIIQLSV